MSKDSEWFPEFAEKYNALNECLKCAPPYINFQIGLQYIQTGGLWIKEGQMAVLALEAAQELDKQIEEAKLEEESKPAEEERKSDEIA